MDAFGDLFRGMRAHGSLFGSTALSPPWALHFVDGAPLTLCTVLGGAGWIVPGHHPPEPLRAGEAVIVRGPASFTFVDEVGTRAEPIACGEHCATPEQGGTRHRLGWNDSGDHAVDGTGARAGSCPGGRTGSSDIDRSGSRTGDRTGISDVDRTGTSDSGGGATTLVVGAYPARGEINRRLLDALPVVLRVASGGGSDPVLEHLAAEAAVDTPGQQVVLDRLLDWMLVCSVRDYFDRPGGEPPAWYAAQRDPVVGDALRLLHAEPAAPWTVSALADRAGVSRSTLAKRFTELVGEPPLTYLARRRMTLAADLLAEREAATVAEIGRAVGYSDAFAFSTAFKRIRGISPSEFRRTGTPASDHPAAPSPR